MKFIIGRKIKMTQLWQGEEVVPATIIAAGPCYITQIKKRESDGYLAVQLGFGQSKEKNVSKPQAGHFKKAELKFFPRYLREFRLTNDQEIDGLAVGAEIKVGIFSVGDTVSVTGISKGKGFQGVVKRHGFAGAKATHGNKDQSRMPGSSGATGPQHVFKGTRKPGRMGGERVTVKNLKVAAVDQINNFLVVKGAVPGARNSLLLISGEGELAIAKDEKIKNENNEKREKINF